VCGKGGGTNETNGWEHWNTVCTGGYRGCPCCLNAHMASLDMSPCPMSASPCNHPPLPYPYRGYNLIRFIFMHPYYSPHTTDNVDWQIKVIVDAQDTTISCVVCCLRTLPSLCVAAGPPPVF
jgi:hypothetical protein